MKQLLSFAILALILIGLTACGGDNNTFTGDSIDILPDRSSSPSELARNMVLRSIESGFTPTKDLTVEELTNDKTYTTVWVTALRQIGGPGSIWLEQYVEVQLVNPTGNQWNIEDYTVWQNTPQQAATLAQATAEMERQTHEEVESLISVEFPKTEGLIYNNSLPTIIRNDHWEGHGLLFRGVLQFAEGELLHFESYKFAISANSTVNYNLSVRSTNGQEWEVIFYKYLAVSVRHANSYANIETSLVEYQLVIDGMEGEIHRIE